MVLTRLTLLLLPTETPCPALALDGAGVGITFMGASLSTGRVCGDPSMTPPVEDLGRAWIARVPVIVPPPHEGGGRRNEPVYPHPVRGGAGGRFVFCRTSHDGICL